MNIIKENSLVKPFIIELKNDPNKHKYVLLWSTKFHRLINKIMRGFPLDTILNNSKYIKYFIIKMTRYFFKYGLYKHDVQKMVNTLYRGVTHDFPVTTSYTERGFLATSMSKDVATRFAGKNGTILKFKTSKLPEDVPFVLIDEHLSEYLAEKEVLMLPGMVHIEKKGDNTKATYKMNQLFYDLNNRPSTSIDGGGDIDKLYDLSLDDEASTSIKLAGKYIVWWRAIIGRQPEVINWMRLPKKKKEVFSFFKEYVVPYDESFEVKTNFIPEYADLKKAIFEKDEKRLKITQAEYELYSSYMVHMAVYDAKKRKVETLHYGMFSEMFSELHNVNKHDIESAIIKALSFL